MEHTPFITYHPITEIHKGTIGYVKITIHKNFLPCNIKILCKVLDIKTTQIQVMDLTNRRFWVPKQNLYTRTTTLGDLTCY